MAEKDVGTGLSNNQAGATPESQRTTSRPVSTKQGKESPASQLDREERLRIIREKQNEDRQKKLEELKQQALAAQKFREQKEEDRRRRMEELRLRDTDRRCQVEERKRQIWQAEKDRREAILRKNQEREVRIETKRKNERSSIFAFGSSTPRMLEPADTGGSYWATRRATSTSNVMMMSMSAAPGPLTRRSSERELDGSKKRATSAGSANRSKQPGEECVDGEESGTATPVPSTRAARRKTDLVPTLPSPRDLTPRPMRSPGQRSGEVTPSRPQSSLSQHSVSGGVMSSSVHAAFKPRATPRRPRPYSIAITGVSSDARLSLSSEHRKSPAPSQDKDKPPLPKVHATKKPATPKSDSLKKPTDKIKATKSSASTTPLQSPVAESASSSVSITTSVTSVNSELSENASTETGGVTVVETSVIVSSQDLFTPQDVPEVQLQQEVPEPRQEVPEPRQEIPEARQEVLEPQQEVTAPQEDLTALAPVQPAADLAEFDMTASMLAKSRITTEEEAKAALAERRRLAREQAEREAELERQRLEAEREAEERRLREEEEEQRRMEEEQLRLLEEARRAEQERLRQAIEEAQRKEEEEKRQREEDAKQKVEKEEAERKAREEVEKQRVEMEIRLKKEEEDRLQRKKRVEAIMSRTRSKGSTPSNTPTKEDGVDSAVVELRQVSDQEQFLHSERTHSAANSSVRQNGHQNGVDSVVEKKNVTNALLDLSIESVSEQILAPTTNTPTNGKLANEDSVNFNTAPSTNPFIAFQDNNTVNDLLS